MNLRTMRPTLVTAVQVAVINSFLHPQWLFPNCFLSELGSSSDLVASRNERAMFIRSAFFVHGFEAGDMVIANQPQQKASNITTPAQPNGRKPKEDPNGKKCPKEPRKRKEGEKHLAYDISSCMFKEWCKLYGWEELTLQSAAECTCSPNTLPRTTTTTTTTTVTCSTTASRLQEPDERMKPKPKATVAPTAAPPLSCTCKNGSPVLDRGTCQSSTLLPKDSCAALKLLQNGACAGSETIKKSFYAGSDKSERRCAQEVTARVRNSTSGMTPKAGLLIGKTPRTKGFCKLLVNAETCTAGSDDGGGDKPIPTKPMTDWDTKICIAAEVRENCGVCDSGYVKISGVDGKRSLCVKSNNPAPQVYVTN